MKVLAWIAMLTIAACGCERACGFQGVSLRRPSYFETTVSAISLEAHEPFSSDGAKSNCQNLQCLDDSQNVNCGLDRRVFIAPLAAITGAILIGEDIRPSAEAAVESSAAAVSLPWEVNPINKRSGVTVFDAEKSGYNVAFVTYLSRFLLNFDSNCQRYWFSSARKLIPKTATAEEVEQIRLDQFAAFSASVELGLRGYSLEGGPRQLLQDLQHRYGTIPPKGGQTGVDEDVTASRRRIAKAARRHIALLFGLLEKNQPTKEMTKLLASVDNGRVSSVQMLKDVQQLDGYSDLPQVIFNPPQAGEGYETAEGKAILQPTGGLLRVDVVMGGSGYSDSPPPDITVSPPPKGGTIAQVQAKIVKGSLESIRVTDPGSGYSEPPRITVAPPPLNGGEAAVVSSVLNMAIDSIEVTKAGSGYAVEKPLKVFVTPSKNGQTKSMDPVLVGLAYTEAEKSSFTSFRRESDSRKLQEEEDKFEARYSLKTLEGISSGTPRLPFWAGRSSSSSELLRLLPAGVGLEYDTVAKRYALAMDTDFMKKYPAVLQQQGTNRLIGTEFGPRGRAPIERDMELGISTYLRFWLSGATCASFVHVLLTPLDVAKTKIQTAPTKYPSIGKAFQKIANEDGYQTFFSGWLPTVLGNFVAGGVLYVTTEFIRRSLSEAAGVDAVALEVPIILAAAGTAAAVGAIISCPFEAVRIRTVAQPDFAPNSLEVVTKMLEEEGVGSLIDAIPIFLIRNIPYAMTKFTIFDISTERLYDTFPVAQEDITLSLLVSLVGGILGGTAAAVVSNPADAVISELKKAKSGLSPQEAVANMLERNGIASFFVGLPLRMVFYSLIASMTFVVYDFVRFLLRIGPDDLKLYLDVLGGSLGKPPT